MVIAVAFDDVKARQNWHDIPDVDGGGVTQTLYFGSRDQPDHPHASLNQPDPGLVASTHFHRVDQFQVVVGGKGRIGRHELMPYCVHFTRAYTPYGPLVSDSREGLQFLVMRARHDAGSQRLPKEREQLERAQGRTPWQISRHVTFTALDAQPVGLAAVPGICDEHGLAAYALCMQPHAMTLTPDPAHGDGQYLAILEGSAILDGAQTKEALAMIFLSPADGPLRVQAGKSGLRGLILNFPRRGAAASTVARDNGTGNALRKWQCRLCAFVYDEAAGLPDEGIAPGTRWADVPDSWSCPDCSISKDDFEMVELKE